MSYDCNDDEVKPAGDFRVFSARGEFIGLQGIGKPFPNGTRWWPYKADDPDVLKGRCPADLMEAMKPIADKLPKGDYYICSPLSGSWFRELVVEVLNGGDGTILIARRA